MKQKELEQYFLNELGQAKFLKAIDPLNIKEKRAFELGSGDGKMSEIVLTKNPLSLDLFEIDKSLINLVSNDDIVNTYNTNILEINYQKYKEHILISAPPYSCLQFISEKIKKENLDFILLISKKYLKLFDDYEILGVLSFNDFTPNSKKDTSHFVITNIRK